MTTVSTPQRTTSKTWCHIRGTATPSCATIPQIHGERCAVRCRPRGCPSLTDFFFAPALFTPNTTGGGGQHTHPQVEDSEVEEGGHGCTPGSTSRCSISASMPPPPPRPRPIAAELCVPPPPPSAPDGGCTRHHSGPKGALAGAHQVPQRVQNAPHRREVDGADH